MKIGITNRFKRSFKALSLEEKKAFKKHIELLIKYINPPFYPSLQIKKIGGISRIFECNINKEIRMTWQYIQSDIILFRNIGKHDRTLSYP
jgi:mRNA-degrading endonuclease YafQ of YafQ-DinJ toxin-antitoxin module